MKEVDLVLSGSGTRFPVFIGCLKALEEKDIKPVRIAGTSGGALVGAGLACGYSASELEKIILNIDFNKFKDFSIFELIFHYGLYKGNILENFIENEITKGKTFADLDCDLNIITTNFVCKQSLIFNKIRTPDVKISKAIRYSLSVPFVFGYRKYENIFLVDGLISSNYAVDIFDDNLRPTVGLRTVGLYECPETKFNIFQYILMCIETMLLSIEKEHIEDAYWAKTINLDVSNFSPINFNVTEDQKLEMFKIGYESTMNRIEEIIGQIDLK